MRAILFFGCFAALTATVLGDCASDAQACKTTFDQAAPAGSNTTTICTAGNTYIRCLRDLQLNVDCAGQNATLQSNRQSAETRLTNEAGVCAHCTRDTDKCLADYQGGANANSASNATAQCIVGQQYVTCMQLVSTKSECASEQTVIDNERRKAEEQLRNAGCATGASCTAAMNQCADARRNAPQTSDYEKCQAMQAYHNCMKQLGGANSVCTGLFEYNVKYAINLIATEEQVANCSVISAGSAGQCAIDATNCKTAFDSAAPAGSDTATICNAGNTYIRCLRDLQLKVDCAGQNATLQRNRQSAENRLSSEAGVCAHCTQETDKCLADYQGGAASHSSADATAQCAAGQKYITCMRLTSTKIECASEQTVVDQERRKAQTELSQAGCDTGASCTAAVNKCADARNQAKQTTDYQKCTAMQAFHNCMKLLDGTDSVCKELYLDNVKYAIGLVATEEQVANCSTIIAGGESSASDFRPTSFVIATVMAAILALR